MITITPAAREMLLYKIMEKECRGIRAKIESAGCNGYAYKLEYVKHDEDTEKDEVYEDMLFIDPKSFIYLAGSQLDYSKKVFEEGFEFSNPNVKDECGCGESVYF